MNRFVLCLGVLYLMPLLGAETTPNILLFIADDASAIHLKKYAEAFKVGQDDKTFCAVTPNLDRLMEEGVWFKNAHANSPSCSPSRAAILTGQDVWRLGPAANLSDDKPKFDPNGKDIQHEKVKPSPCFLLDSKFPIYTRTLAHHNYQVGFSGKGYGPAEYNGDKNALPSKWNNQVDNPNRPKSCYTNPVGEFWGKIQHKQAFQDFYEKRVKPTGKPFCFWVGITDPHRPYPSYDKVSKKISEEDLDLPKHLPNVSMVRKDYAGYLWELEQFDRKVGEVLDYLKVTYPETYEDTLVIVTSDHGMPFLRAKATCYWLGTHVPLIAYWKKGGVVGGHGVTDFVSLKDLAPTILEVANLEVPNEMTGSSLLSIMSNASKPLGRVEPNNKERDYVVTGRERHALKVRQNKMSYPIRSIITEDWHYIQNYNPERWPAGDPKNGGVNGFGESGRASGENNDATDWILKNKNEKIPGTNKTYFNVSLNKRPQQELYNLRVDLAELSNLNKMSDYIDVRDRLALMMSEYLLKTKDPRELNIPNLFDSIMPQAYNEIGSQLRTEK